VCKKKECFAKHKFILNFKYCAKLIYKVILSHQIDRMFQNYVQVFRSFLLNKLDLLPTENIRVIKIDIVYFVSRSLCKNMKILKYSINFMNNCTIRSN